MRTLMLGVALLAGAPAAAQIATAKVTGGTVAGTVVDGLSEYKGIPFAAPPVGALRWKAPQPVRPWAGVRQTTAFGAACMQDPKVAQMMGSTAPLSEDCLFIDVWSPARSAGEKLPVIAWIYGGGFNGGMTSVPLYDGANFAKKGVVFVSISYRVGPFGFLATPELSRESGHGSGNYGLLDQIAGLKWIQANVAKFGGDPAKVTILGHSAGAYAVSELAASPLAKGLFRGVIAQSGANFTPPQASAGGIAAAPLVTAEAAGKKWLASLGATTLAQARALPAATLEEGQRAPGAPRFAPPLDGYVLPTDQASLWRAKRFNDVPVIVGSTSDEAAAFGAKPVEPASFEAEVRRDYGARADMILAAFPHADGAAATRAAKQLRRDTAFGWPAFAWGSLQAENGRAPVYVYYFDRPTAQNPDGSGHGSEVGLVFGNEDHRPGRPDWTDEDRALSKAMQSYWVTFAATGSPNGAGLPQWPAFSPANPQVMRFGKEGGVAAMPNLDKYRALDDYYRSMSADGR